MAGKKAPSVKTEQVKVFVYIGPSIRGVIQEGTIYRGTQTEVFGKLDAAIGKYPEIATLVVEDTALAAAREKIKSGGNAISIAYKALA